MFVSDYDVLLRLSKNRTSEQLLDNNNKYIVGRLIGLGLMVEKESPAAERTLVEKLNRDTKYGGNSELKGIFRRFNNDYQITSFGKSFLIFLVEQSGI
jgi:hypothetical protein